MGMLENYYESNMKSNATLEISEITTATYLLKLKDDDLISIKTLNFIRN